MRLPVFLLACLIEAPVYSHYTVGLLATTYYLLLLTTYHYYIEAPVYSVPMVLVGARAEGLAQVVSGTAPLSPEVRE